MNAALIKSHQFYLKFMMKARDTHGKVIKPRKGQTPKINSALILYRKCYQPYQMEVLETLKKLIKEG